MLTTEQLRKAVEFNATQWNLASASAASPAFQAALGPLETDGHEPKDEYAAAKAIYAFQLKQGLVADGKYGPVTRGKLKSEPLPLLTEIGVWAGSSVIAKPGAAMSRIKACGFTHVDLMVSDGTAKNPKALKLPASMVVKAIKEAREFELTVSMTTWAIPWTSWYAQLRDTVAPLAEENDITELCLDCEEPFTQNTIDAQRDAELTIQALREGGYTGKISVTAIVFHPKEVAPLAMLADELVPQPYVTVNTIANFTPTQLLNLARSRFAKYGKPLTMGLASYKKPQPVTEIVIQELMRCRQMGVTRVRFWSYATCHTVAAAIARTQRVK